MVEAQEMVEVQEMVADVAAAADAAPAGPAAAAAAATAAGPRTYDGAFLPKATPNQYPLEIVFSAFQDLPHTTSLAVCRSCIVSSFGLASFEQFQTDPQHEICRHTG